MRGFGGDGYGSVVVTNTGRGVPRVQPCYRFVMADEPESIVLRYLRRIDEKLDRLADDVRDIKIRVTGVEENLAGVHRRLDRIELRVEHIEKRLDLVQS